MIWQKASRIREKDSLGRKITSNFVKNMKQNNGLLSKIILYKWLKLIQYRVITYRFKIKMINEFVFQ